MSARAIFALILVLASPGCMFKKKTPPPTPPPAVINLPPAKKPPPTVVNLPPPDIRPSTASAPAPPVTEQPPLPPAPKPQPKTPRRQRNPQPPPPAAAPVTTPQPAPPPKLDEILTPAQQAEMNRTVDQALGAARASLARLRGRQLTSEQFETSVRIRTFIDQADQARKTDPRSAVQLARRAEVLARDLEASIR